jgi:hypothetical protein
MITRCRQEAALQLSCGCLRPARVCDGQLNGLAGKGVTPAGDGSGRWG